MPVNLKCPLCGQSLRMPDEVLGKKVTCPTCDGRFRVSQGSSPPPEAMPAGASKGQERGGLPPWAYAALGGAVAAVVLVGLALVSRSLGGAASSRYPDPSADVILGVASELVPRRAEPATTAPTTPTPEAAVAHETPPAASAKGAPLTTAQIVARWDASVALVKGHAQFGTGFLVKPGVVVTNAHIIEGEFIDNIEVRFPSAPDDKQGPLTAELLFEDSKRDLAFLAVSTDLPATDVAPSYRFVKGEDVTVIGNPGLGDDIVLENAISRGVMSVRTAIDGMNFFQMNMSINGGNSGGPVFDSTGRVIGVATLKAAKGEALAFCVPAEELNAALSQVGAPRPDLVSRHRVDAAFKLLTIAGALYGVGLEVRASLLRKAPAGANLISSRTNPSRSSTRIWPRSTRNCSQPSTTSCKRSRPTRHSLKVREPDF